MYKIYMAIKSKTTRELIGVMMHETSWIVTMSGDSWYWKEITKVEYETYLAFGIAEMEIVRKMQNDLIHDVVLREKQ